MDFTVKPLSRKGREGSLRTLRPGVLAVKFFAPFCFLNPVFSQPSSFVPNTKIEFFKLGNKIIPVQITKYGEQNGIVCLNLHDDEFTSVNAAMSVLKETGGTLIKIQNKKQRMIEFRLKNKKYIFDPNRMFSKEGIKSSVEKKAEPTRDVIDAVEQFGKQILALIPDTTQCLIALHNNTPGLYSVKSYLRGGDLESDAKHVSRNKLQDEDDIILTTDSTIYAKMAEAGYNSIWQDNKKARKDGSLSVYYGERTLCYVNIETQHGKIFQYKTMLKNLLENLVPLPPPTKPL